MDINIGLVFNKLTIVEKIGEKGDNYGCLCDCGQTTIGHLSDMKREFKKSCGCSRNENKKKFNTFEEKDDYMIGFAVNGMFYFDKEDFDKVKLIYWKLDKNGHVYARNWDKVNKKEIRYTFHRFLMNPNDDVLIDHANRVPYDNRKINLRNATHAQNSANQSISKKNTSGIIGVSFYKNLQKWVSQLGKGKREYYNNFKDAVISRLKQEKDLLGEFAPQKHLFEEYGILTSVK